MNSVIIYFVTVLNEKRKETIKEEIQLRIRIRYERKQSAVLETISSSKKEDDRNTR